MMNRYQYLSLFTALFLILSMESSLVYNYVTQPTVIILPVKVFGKIATSINAKVYDSDMHLKANVTKDNDLITNNFRNFLINWLLTGYVSTGAKSVVLKDSTNTDRTINTRIDTTAYANYFVDSASGTDPKGGYIGIGSGTTAPAVTDYNLQTIYGALTAVGASFPTYDLVTGDLVITSTIAITGNVNISEGSVYVRWIPSAGTTSFYFMMTHDTFAPIACVNGDTFVLTVTINFSNDISNTIGTTLGSLFKNVADGSTTYVIGTNLKSTVNSDFTVTVYAPGTSSGIINHYNLNTLSSGTTIGLSPAPSSRSMYCLQNPVEALTQSVPDPYIDSNNIVIISDVTCLANRLVYEASYQTQFSIASSAYFMLFRCVLASPVSITAGHAVRIEFIISL